MAKTKEPENTEEDNVVTAIRQISQGMAKLQNMGLRRRAIVVLLADCTKVGRKQIESVLDGLATLEKTYTVKT